VCKEQDCGARGRLKGQHLVEGLEFCKPRSEILSRLPRVGTQSCTVKGGLEARANV
jgi:hypothetical protein